MTLTIPLEEKRIQIRSLDAALARQISPYSEERLLYYLSELGYSPLPTNADNFKPKEVIYVVEQRALKEGAFQHYAIRPNLCIITNPIEILGELPESRVDVRNRGGTAHYLIGEAQGEIIHAFMNFSSYGTRPGKSHISNLFPAMPKTYGHFPTRRWNGEGYSAVQEIEQSTEKPKSQVGLLARVLNFF